MKRSTNKIGRTPFAFRQANLLYGRCPFRRPFLLGLLGFYIIYNVGNGGGGGRKNGQNKKNKKKLKKIEKVLKKCLTISFVNGIMFKLSPCESAN